jgi:hypothetical protein
MRFALRSFVVALIGAYLLVAPFDCFATTGVTREAADCCAKGNCVPTKNSDSCCKRTVPNGRDFVSASNRMLVHSLAPVDLIADEQSFSLFSRGSASPHFESSGAPPGSPPGSRLNLPLLI